ncbi:GMC family oxidoreductase [Amycolatopsis acidiphila]|nr:GMC family oxidoreductase [Amycolatopsis acidiphila]GHG89277.1 cholesterol oxidase [Amycolatopsis acidiphila]
MSYDYDVVVIGSGFGGSVTALRLTEKGYRVGVLEAGRRFDESSYPRTSWDLRNFLWAPRLGCFGLQRIALLRDVVVLAAAGVGGGSLLYANTLYEPASDAFYLDPQWRDITDWRAELAPHYDQAKRMLGVVTNPLHTPADTVIRQVAHDMGVGHTFRPTPVGVFFGPPGTEPGTDVADPFFGGAGPTRRTCVGCGSCMTGCRHNAKNTLPKNYLHLAESHGAEVHPMTTVTEVRPRPCGGYTVRTVRTGKPRRPAHERVFTAEQVVFAAGTYHTQKLLHRLRDEGVLPEISGRLGELTRTNSEAILSAKSRLPKADFSTGIAITSSFHPDENTHVEPVRYGKGSNAMALMQTALTDGGGRVPRWLRWLKEMTANPRHLSWHVWPRRWSEKSIILLVMQSLDNSITVSGRKGLFGRHKLTSKQGHGRPNPSWIPAANEATRRTAEKIDGIAGGTIGEIANIPLTAHFIGGCPIGNSPEDGVLDAWQRLYGHPGLHVIDGSAVSANLGVNPSLTITAQAERAMSFWPNKGQPDLRPPLGERYRPLPAVAPANPAVPAGAPGALRLTGRS